MNAVERVYVPRWYKVGTVLVALLVMSVLAVTLFLLNREVIYEGISINGIDVGGKDPQQAIKVLEAAMEGQLEQQLVLVHGGDTWTTSLKSIGGRFEYYKAVEAAYRVGREGDPVSRIKKILDIRDQGHDLNLEFGYDLLALRAFLQRIDRQISRPAINATIERSGDTFTVTPESKGLGVDVEKTIEQISTELKALDFSPKPVVVFDKIPDITHDMLSGINTRWSVFSTVFNPDNVGRSENLKIASQAIDGIVLGPGKVFSFNDATGLRIAENGYQEAPVIFEGQLVPGIGGGVCQVSSTLYNAALYANLEIVERHRHTIPSAYIGMGRDATVVDKVLDLKIRNNSDGYVYIASWVQGNRVYTAIYGNKREHDIKVKISTEVIEVIEPVIQVVIDHSLPAGQEVVEREGRKGYRVRAFKQVFIDGKAGEPELMYTDLYRPENGLVRKSAKQVNADTSPKPDEHGTGNMI